MSENNPTETRAIKLTHAIYALQASSFFLGVTLIIAVMINYVKRNDVKDSWLASHFIWQIRSFWYSLVWLTIGGITFRHAFGQLVLSIGSLWLLYRIIKGWLYLFDKKPLYQSAVK